MYNLHKLSISYLNEININKIIDFVYPQEFDFTADDLQDQGEIGRGNYGTVNKMYHERSDTVMAVKVC